MRALVLGGAGFLGRHLCDRLVAAGHAVTIYGRTIPPRLACPGGETGVRRIAGDIRDADRLGCAARGMDWVFHLAGDAAPHLSNLEAHRRLLDDLNAVVNVLDVCVTAGVRKLLFASSGGTVYGPAAAPRLSENHPTNPICSYGIAKLAAEKYLELYRHLHGLPCAILRIANSYGEWQRCDRGQGVITAWMSKILRGEAVTVWGDGEQVRDFVYVEDVAAAMLAAAEAAELRHSVFNVGSGVGTSLNQLLPMLARLTGQSVAVHYRPGRRSDVSRAVLDVRRARHELGWHAQTSLELGLQRTWSWVRQGVENPGALDGVSGHNRRACA
ncbi:hypothetical protein AYO44_12430 [Planctomycetaceae bacterium SCGC AG-212-F19]|nr:hypothetical protein AYO44_12430 [Planctomycetaceae bacterium SCGC AG-212-F19]